MLWSPCWLAPATHSPPTVAFRNKTASNRTKPECNLPNSDSRGKFSEERSDPEAEWLYPLGFSTVPADTTKAQSDADAAHCHAKFELDPLKFDCTSKHGWCKGRRYLSRDTLAASGTGQVHADTNVPADVKATLDSLEFKGTKLNDGRYLGPPRPTGSLVTSARGLRQRTPGYALLNDRGNLDWLPLVPFCRSARIGERVCKPARNGARCGKMLHAKPH